MDRPTDPPPPVSDRRAAWNQRLRAASIEGAERQSVRTQGRGLSDRELRRVIRRYPGDVGER